MTGQLMPQYIVPRNVIDTKEKMDKTQESRSELQVKLSQSNIPRYKFDSRTSVDQVSDQSLRFDTMVGLDTKQALQSLQDDELIYRTKQFEETRTKIKTKEKVKEKIKPKKPIKPRMIKLPKLSDDKKKGKKYRVKKSTTSRTKWDIGDPREVLFGKISKKRKNVKGVGSIIKPFI